MAALSRLCLFLAGALAFRGAADCWDLQHPDDPRPSTLDPIPVAWRRPPWARLPETAQPPRPLGRPARTCNVRDFGARGDSTSSDTSSIQAAIDACTSKGGGRVLIPAPGLYLSGPVDLGCAACGDGVELEIEDGAVLRASLPIAGWPVGSGYPDHHVGAAGRAQFTPFIGANSTKAVAIIGGGTVDLNGREWWVNQCAGRSFPQGAERPFGVRFDTCSGVRIEGVTFLNPPFWTVVPTSCSGVVVHNISVVAPTWSPNTDGIEPMNSTDVRVTSCFVHNGDDCMTVKGGCRNVLAADNYFMAGHGATIGSVTDLDVDNVTFRHILLNATTNALQIKGHADSKPATVSNILYEDIRFVNLTQFHDRHHDPAMAIHVEMNWGGGARNPTGVHIENLTVRNFSGDSLVAGVLRCREDNACHGVRFEDVHVDVTGDPSKYSVGWDVTAAHGEANDVVPDIALGQFQLTV